ncbi:hypothetical protein SCP_0905240 [Sparassis crispa]|uniref:Uncharacterized protein n=1 Tax=Sparassis crispa TaxID=139825 RepID=A0A401GXW8_9APHY|nr:hypothetical protein SCP_0905240 [Sparassis crispa]GBE86644.1 hypothetical protein SCP_0905240 [Sparassis crispa]
MSLITFTQNTLVNVRAHPCLPPSCSRSPPVSPYQWDPPFAQQLAKFPAPFDVHDTLRELELLASSLPAPSLPGALPRIVVTTTSSTSLPAHGPDDDAPASTPSDEDADDMRWVEEYGAWGASDKGKWRATLIDGGGQASDDPPLTTTPPAPDPAERYYIYDPLTAPEFLAGTSTSLIARLAHGAHSAPPPLPRPAPRPRNITDASASPKRPTAVLIPPESAHDLWLMHASLSNSTAGSEPKSARSLHALSHLCASESTESRSGAFKARFASLDQLAFPNLTNEAGKRVGAGRRTGLRHAVLWSLIQPVVGDPEAAAVGAGVEGPRARRKAGASVRRWFRRFVR